MSKVVTSFTAIALSILASAAYADDAVLRIRCFGENAGATVYINNKVKGECPITITLPEGVQKLRVHKAVNEEFEQVFEQVMHLGGGVVKDMEISLPPPALTAKAKLARQVEADRKAAVALAQKIEGLRLAAARGDIDAMTELAWRYDIGEGVTKDADKAQAWHDKAVAAEAEAARLELQAAERGDVVAMDAIAKRYDTGKGVKMDQLQAQAWRNRAALTRNEEQARAAARARAARKQARLDAFTFFPATKKVFDQPNSCDVLTMMTFLPVSLLSDLLEMPSNSTKLTQINNEAAVRPGRWGKPDSMIAKAAAQKQQKAKAAATAQLQEIASLR